MEVKQHIKYDTATSAARIDSILLSGYGDFASVNDVPSRTDLTFKNGCYVNVSALFIDIVDSSEMTDFSKKITLAKIYRCFISECVAILSELSFCQEVSIHGDCVWGIFNTKYPNQFYDLFDASVKLYSCIRIINKKLEKYGYRQIQVGIGCDFGRALMVKAGFCGSGINDVIWMGDVVNSACHLSGEAGREGKPVMLYSNAFYNKLSYNCKNKLKWYWSSSGTGVYGETLINVEMEGYLSRM